MAAKKNCVTEILRFVLSIFVVGYHTRSIVDYGGNPLFQFGYFAVEFFFILSGFLLAMSLERAYTAERFGLLPDTGRFMWRKIKPFLPFHLIAVVLMMVVIAAFDTSSFAARLESGWTGIFLLQSAVVWTTCEGLIVPEWYLSTMLIAILIIYPCARLLGRKIKRKVFVPVILIAGLAVVAVAVGFGTNWSFSWNLSNDLRGFGEMCAGMLCLSQPLSFGQRVREKNAYGACRRGSRVLCRGICGNVSAFRHHGHDRHPDCHRIFGCRRHDFIFGARASVCKTVGKDMPENGCIIAASLSSSSRSHRICLAYHDGFAGMVDSAPRFRDFDSADVCGLRNLCGAEKTFGAPCGRNSGGSRRCRSECFRRGKKQENEVEAKKD